MIHPITPYQPHLENDSPSQKGEKREFVGADPTRPVGPGNPPAHGMIKPGEVRNPFGAAGYFGKNPAAGAKKIVREFLTQEIEIVLKDDKGNSRREKKRRWDALMDALYGRAMKGDVQAIRAMKEFGFGKDVQPVEHSGTIGKSGLPNDMEQELMKKLEGFTDDEIRRLATAGENSSEDGSGSGG